MKRKILAFVIYLITIISIALVVKANQPKIIGYKYTSGASSVWALAEKYCPNEIDIQKFVYDIEKINQIENSNVYNNKTYKIPVYDSESEINADYLIAN